MYLVHTLASNDFNDHVGDEATSALETGSVIYLPQLPFTLADGEKTLLSPDFVKPGVKNISYNPENKQLRGLQEDLYVNEQMAQMMGRYVDFSSKLIESLFPHYKGHYELGKTSYRPVEIKGRESSYRKDDTRLHVDAFPSNPNNGKRILRVFSNINPNNQARHWRIGEPFSAVANRFLPKIPKPMWGKHKLLEMLGVTKKIRKDYDHYMLQMHNRMKADVVYQKNVEQGEFDFLPNTTWIVFTDLVSHAAMAGQYVLEQTFYLPVEHMKFPERAPLRVLENMLGRKLA